ncbi:hypothetical protein EDB80DRAFT_162024 [Ilyonectria destructans]|nr:hypothetical protein EDB80DRAFT_162024 [Ilyonectria destructans]
MSKQDSGNISPLHRQLVKRRTIVVTEDPKLHLAWIHDRIFIKPLPRYITSYAFWRDYLCTETGSGGLEHIRQAALGYLRTYYHLVQHESDLRIAQDPSLCLVPPDITWEQFCDFTSSLADIADRDVSLRYAYGEIRLTRLNLYAPLLLGKSHFQRVEHQYGTYFAQHRRKIADAYERVWMLSAEHLLLSIQSSSVHLLRLLVLSLVLQHRRKIADARECVWMVSAEHLLLSIQSSSVHLLCLLVLSLVLQHPRKIADARECV